VLGAGVVAQAGACVFLYGLPFLLPVLRTERHLSLPAAGALVGAPSLGLLATLVAWGAAADRFGERVVISAGLWLTAGLLFVGSLLDGPLLLGLVLALAGGAAGSVNAASGRMVMGWFDRSQRGLAMGIRQTSQPLGVAIAALTLPVLGRHGVRPALLYLALVCAVTAVVVRCVAADPARAPRAAAPAAAPFGDRTLWRIYGSSACLVVPQFAVSAFALTYLVEVRGWAAVPAGRLVFLAQLAGAAARIGSGVWSDRAGSRMRPMRQLGCASAVVMLLLALGAWRHSELIVAAFLAGAVITVADNGLAFTAVAERAGAATAGRALGALNTVQNVAAGLTPAFVGAVAGSWGYGWGFAAVAVFPAVAVPFVPLEPWPPVRLGTPCAESSAMSDGRTPSR
jgi:sugar phosphate permease